MTQPERKASRMTWNGTAKRAREIVDWGRDEALILFVAATPPSRDAKPDTPEAEWQLKAMVPVPAELGGGVQWVDVPKGSVIRNTNTGTTAWTDPVFEVVTAQASARAFEE